MWQYHDYGCYMLLFLKCVNERMLKYNNVYSKRSDCGDWIKG